MNFEGVKKLYLISVLYFFSISILGQDKSGPGESVLLTSDRALYAAGEPIHFSCRVFYQGSDQRNASSILYLELITPNGEQISGYKFSLENQECKGSILIPEKIVSGNYYLRAYTKLMRNSDLCQMSYCHLKIVNPLNDEINDIPDLHANKYATLREDSTALENFFDITFETLNFNNREKVSVHIKGKDINLCEIYFHS